MSLAAGSDDHPNHKRSGQTLYPQFHVILLAAGTSARMGAPNKLLIEWQNEPLIRRTVRLYTSLGMPVTAVLGYQAEAVRATLADLSLQTVINSRFAEGQASSIRAGLQFVSSHPAHLIMALGDQPLLEAQDIKDLCEAFLSSEQDQILVPFYKGKRGNPAVLPQTIIPHLKDTGQLPRAFMEAYPDRLARFNARNAHFTTDIDTPEDLQKLRAR